MLQGRKDKQKLVILLADLPGLLRGLADALSGGPENAGCLVDPDTLEKLEIKVLSPGKGGQVRVKVSHRLPQEEGGERSWSKDSFKPLKKRMKRSFKALSEAAGQARMPGEAEVAAFVEDYQDMMARLYGAEEDPESRMGLCRALVAALEAADADGLARAAEDLRQQMRDCHKASKG